MWPRCPECGDLVSTTVTMKGRTRSCVSSSCKWQDFTPEEPYDDTPWAVMRGEYSSRQDAATPLGEPDEVVVYDERPGNYYVVAHPEAKPPQDGCYFVAGPFQSHRRACDMLASVKREAEQHAASRVLGMRWITARTESDDVRTTMLGIFDEG